MTSYAISPQATVTCAPCSIRCRPFETRPAQRYTYCSIVVPKPRIVGFLEECPEDSAPGRISTFSVELKTSSPAIHLDTIQLSPSGDANVPDIGLIVKHKNGQITCYESKLQREIWSEQVAQVLGGSQPGEETTHIQYSNSFSVEQARTGLLRQRDDILALLSEVQDGSATSLLLFLDSTSSPQEPASMSVHLRLYSVGVSNSSPKSRSVLRQLLSQDINIPEGLGGGLPKYFCHIASGTLYMQTARGIAVLDISVPIPCLTYYVQSEQGDIGSCLRISSTLLATTTAHSMNIISLPYCSMQASKDLRGEQSSSNRPRRHDGHKTISAGACPHLFSYSAKQNIVIAIDGSRLIAIPLPKSESKLSKKRKREGLLISSLGRGSSMPHGAQLNRASTTVSKTLGQSLTRLDQEPLWERQIKALDDFLGKGDNKAFDDTMASELGIGDPTPSPISQQKVSYILSRIFKIKEANEQENRANEHSEKLEVSFWPTRISQWLLENNLLTSCRVESSLKHYGFLPITSKLALGALIDALAEYDSSLDIMKALLASPLPMFPVELSHSLAFVTRRFMEEEPNETIQPLTNGNDHLSSDEENKMQIVELNGSSNLKRQTGDAKPRDPEANRKILRIILKKLHGFPSASVTPALRRTFTTPELRSLVDILRLETAHNGWLSAYADNFPHIGQDCLANDQMALISHVLNSILDALGPAGWMLGSSSVDELANSKDVISHMKAEISAALEGVEEITYLKGMLGEILLCGKDSLVPPSKKALEYTSDETSKAQPIKPMSVALREEESNILPLGLKLKPKVPKTKVGAGGELVTRSQRNIGHLKSRMVGKYSFERILV